MKYFLLYLIEQVFRVICLSPGGEKKCLFLLILNDQNIIKHKHGLRHTDLLRMPCTDLFELSAIIVAEIADGTACQRKLCGILFFSFLQFFVQNFLKGFWLFFSVTVTDTVLFSQDNIRIQSDHRISAQLVFQCRIQKYCHLTVSVHSKYICCFFIKMQPANFCFHTFATILCTFSCNYSAAHDRTGSAPPPDETAHRRPAYFDGSDP